MKTLIFATNDSSAGRLKASKAADKVVAMCQRLVEGPLPSSESGAAFFGPVGETTERSQEATHWLGWVGVAESQRLGKVRPSLVETCQLYDRIQIWTDPDPSSYLVLFQLIDALKSRTDLLDRVYLAFPSRYVGELSAAGFKKTRPRLEPLSLEQVNIISLVWQAHHWRTPERWFNLLSHDLSGLPDLRTMIVRILAELPAATNGLSASEALMLAQFKSSEGSFEMVLGGYVGSRPRPTLDYWEIGRRIATLSRCEPPIILGVGEDAFSLDLHDDEARFAAYRARTWSLSPLGERVAEGREDLCAYVPVDRWLGNTHLTVERLWRWDAKSETLIKPK